MSRDLHAEDRARRLARGTGIVRRENSAGLAALARRHLRLDHHGHSERRCGGLRLGDIPGQAPARNRDSRRLQQWLRRVLLEVHDAWFPYGAAGFAYFPYFSQ